MAINYQSLLSGGATGWHAGAGTITYSFLGSPVPNYYPKYDYDGDGTDDSYAVLTHSTNGAVDEIIALDANVALSSEHQALALKAIKAWNDVARINLEPGTTDPFIGTEITGTGALVGGLGGAAGFGETEVPRNDDGSTSYDLSSVFENGLDFYGTTFSSVYVNTNGNISFGSSIGTFTPSQITAGATRMIAPFWADVDTRPAGSGPIYVDLDTDQDVVTMTWSGVGYYSQKTNLLNSFQLQLYDRGAGDFDIVFRYGDINWTTGDASGGTGGLGGTIARAGWSAGNSQNFFELPQSGSQGAITALESTAGNTGVSGLWVWQVRNGAVAVGDITFGEYAFRSTDGTDGYQNTANGKPVLSPDGEPNSELEGFVSKFPPGGTLGTASQHGDVWLNTSHPSIQNAAEGNRGYYVFVHELGHALGLTHPNGNGEDEDYDASHTVMSYFNSPDWKTTDAWPTTPMPLDIQAVQKLYGANFDTRNTSTTYFGGALPGTTSEFAFRGHAIMTIWDGGGDNDWINCASETDPVKIDLRPGAFSQIGSLIDNIAMAYLYQGDLRSLIENAIGGSKMDTLIGNQVANILDGRDERDSVMGREGNDILYGGGGDDFLYGGTDTMSVGTGDDTLYGQDGFDQLVGGDGADYLNGGDDSDSLYGQDGNDTLDGGASNDYLGGGAGTDSLYAGSGSDIVQGGGDSDYLDGNVGTDTMYGEGGDDTIDGGADADYIDGGEGQDSLFGRDGNDTMKGGQQSDALLGDAGADYLFGEEGDDYLSGGADGDYMEGGVGNDTLDGGAVADYMDGGAGADSLYAGDGNDSVHGGDGNDYIGGQNGADSLYGEAGNDVLDGGGDSSNDYLDGGAFGDAYIFGAGMGHDVIGSFDDSGGGGFEDYIYIDDAIVGNFTTLSTAMSQSGAHVIINLGGFGGIQINNVTMANLGADDFIFY